MDKNSAIVITGSAGFIGSCLVAFLNEKGFSNLILVDRFDCEDKDLNLKGKRFSEKVDLEDFFSWLTAADRHIDFVFHLGAKTDTTEFDYSVHERLNVEYSKKIWTYCEAQGIPLVYASSAATYGGGEKGYDDDHMVINRLRPLNPYGVSKNEFDKWVLRQKSQPPFWAGLKFFNVYGPNEYHKGRMASMVWHSFNQIRSSGEVRLFRSHRPDFKDGQQLRDFIYVKDVLKVCYWLMNNRHAESSIYNLGTGGARSFEDLARFTFAGAGRHPEIVYVDMPEDIRDKYQYFTEANMSKLRKAGYHEEFYTLESGVADYVGNYLMKDSYY
jgi:ADP-L-glycero-D-manno-heptose 6-epimerase